jgi:hypothetical protein
MMMMTTMRIVMSLMTENKYMVTMNISRMLMTRKRMRSIEESTSQHLHHKRIVIVVS